MSQNQKLSVTVLLNVYNTENTIQPFIQSLKNQTYKDFHLLIIDDGSTDSTITEIEKYKDIFNMTICKRSHEGLQKARKFGVNEARGEIIVVLDADLILDKNAIEELIAPLKNDNVGGVGSGENVSINNLAEEVVGLTNSKSKVVHERERKGEIKHSLADISKIENIGFKPKVELKEGLEKLITFFE